MTAHRPWILGIGSSYHNGAACLLRGDEVVVAIQEERLLRMKRAMHPASRPSLAIQYCLDYANIRPRDLACIAVSRLSEDDAADDVTLSPQLQAATNRVPVVTISHHQAHAVAVFALSGFPSAAVLVVDGRGSPIGQLAQGERQAVLATQRARHRDGDPTVCETVSIYQAVDRSVKAIEKQVAAATPWRTGRMRRFFSLGSLFLNVGAQIFGEGLDGSGKVMGLAPYGNPTIPREDFFDVVDGEFVFSDRAPARFDAMPPWPNHDREYADLAASTQAALEEALLMLAARIKDTTPERRLCYAGGVALNSVANEVLARSSAFADMFVMPAAEDSGVALGAAYHALWELTGHRCPTRQRRDNMGRRYSCDDIGAAVAKHGQLRSLRSPSPVEDAAEMLAAGKIVGWFTGGSEFGPRALGQRSILADPRRPDIKDVLNARVKFRESFRPYAPAILQAHAESWVTQPTAQYESPFMLRVVEIRPERRDAIPGVVHVDGTARIQTVTRDGGQDRFYDLLEAFHRRTGVPVLLNTSFNTAGEPIVETPEDALWCLMFSGLDACVLEDVIVEKSRDADPLCWAPVIAAESIMHSQAPAGAARGTALRGIHHSVCADRCDELNLPFCRLQMEYVRVITRGRWGRVAHFIGPELLFPLSLMDGSCIGYDILEQWNAQGAKCSSEDFLRTLHRLASTNILTFRNDRHADIA
jgi:carbamoyltransferase